MSYIYGIFIGDKCIYIGSTDNYERRWKEHRKALENGKHSNKTLQKKYDTYGNLFEYRIIKEINTESTLIKFMAEMLCNSYYKPTCAKCIISQGRSRIILSRCDKELALELLKQIK